MYFRYEAWDAVSPGKTYAQGGTTITFSAYGLRTGQAYQVYFTGTRSTAEVIQTSKSYPLAITQVYFYVQFFLFFNVSFYSSFNFGYFSKLENYFPSLLS
jgi:hypothetical protein